MKSSSFFFLTFFIIQSSVAQVNWTTKNLKGKPHELTRTKYYVINGEISDSTTETSVCNFDSDGNAYQIRTHKSNEVRLTHIYFNQIGCDTLWIVLKNDTIDHKWRKQFQQQKIINKRLLDYNDSTDLETNYYYDSNGINYRKETIYKSGFSLKVIKTHDSSGVLIQELWYNINDKLTDTWIIIYDKDGNETENIGVDVEENTFYRDRRYFNNYKDWTKVEELDRLGNVILTSEWYYIYDDQNNWIEEKEFENGELVSYQKREIVYP